MMALFENILSSVVSETRIKIPQLKTQIKRPRYLRKLDKLIDNRF